MLLTLWVALLCSVSVVVPVFGLGEGMVLAGDLLPTISGTVRATCREDRTHAPQNSFTFNPLPHFPIARFYNRNFVTTSSKAAIFGP